MTCHRYDPPAGTRRQFLNRAACGFGSLAFAGMAAETARASGAGAQPVTPDGLAHHAPRAKRVIFLFMHGGPSHVDTFDYKPALQERSGQILPFAPAKNLDPSATRQAKLLGSPWEFSQRGKSGLWVSELFPHVAEHADKLCVVRSMQSKGQSHGQAVCMMHTGADNFVRPSVGAWVSYGLAEENRDLPAFISISPSANHGGPRNYGSAFLPAKHQATTIGSTGKLPDKATFRYLSASADGDLQARKLAMLQAMNREHLERTRHAPVEGMIQSMELAFRMQSAAPPVIDIEDEPDHIKELYGIGGEATDNYGRQCLLARRFAEAGVRYIQVNTANVWDQHGNLKGGHEKNSLAVDKPIAGLLADLDQRGLLEDTLVVWGGEFGRTPIVQGSNGRDHERLTYRYAGRDFRLTDVYGHVVKEIMA